MKKILFTSLFAAACVAVMSLSSCMNGDYDANPTGAVNGTNPLNPGGGGGGGGTTTTGKDPMSAKVNGNVFQAVTATATPSSVQGVNFDGVQGLAADNSKIDLSYMLNAAPGTYNINSTTGDMSYYPADGSDVYSTLFGGGGTVIIVENDATHVKGTFSGSPKDFFGKSVAISEGYFNIKK